MKAIAGKRSPRASGPAELAPAASVGLRPIPSTRTGRREGPSTWKYRAIRGLGIFDEPNVADERREATAGVPEDERRLVMRIEGPGCSPMTRFRSFDELARHLAAEGAGDEIDLHPRLRFGAVWWIPDRISGFGQGLRHPWVVVVGYDAATEEVVVVPRTTTGRAPARDVLETPAGVLPALEQSGRVLLRFRVPIPASRFVDCDFIGYLDEVWQERLRQALAALANDAGPLGRSP